MLPYAHRDARTTSRMEIGDWICEHCNRTTAKRIVSLQRYRDGIKIALASALRYFVALQPSHPAPVRREQTNGDNQEQELPD